MFYPRLMLFFVFVTLCAGWTLSPAAAQIPDPPTNIVFLFADDLGYGDLACYGAPDVRTPNIDHLASEGVRFTQHYSNAPECSPTRTAFFTGRYQQRAGGMECALGTGNVGRYDDAIRLAEQHQLGLPVEQAVLPALLKQAGYTMAIFGKWHLGYEPQFNPMRYGFDRFFGCLGGNVDYFRHIELSPLPVLYENDHPIERPGYMTHLIADDAVEFVRSHRGEPFFLYVPFTSPHFPFQGPGDAGVPLADDAWTTGTRPKYVEMVEDLDAQVGRILATLEAGGLVDRTLVVFASDNGAMAPGRNLPFADYKSTAFEGGIHVPLMIRWPGHLPPGAMSHQTCATFDLTRSFLRVAGAPEPTDRPLDGIDLVAHVEQNLPEVPRTLFWRFRRGERIEAAARDGDMKFINRRLDDGSIVRHLFDLAVDPCETNDLAERRPDESRRMLNLLNDWQREVRAVR